MSFFKNLFKKSEGKETAQLRDTQLIIEDLDLPEYQFPVFSNSGETISWDGKTFSLIQWLEIFKDKGQLYIALPEKDYGEPRYQLDWNIFRTHSERSEIEDGYISIYANYAKILVGYSREKKLNFNQEQFVHANVAMVWLHLAPKYKLLRREFLCLQRVIEPRLEEAIRSALS